jgi:DNA-binding CsgD family transcriptional regulator
MSVLLDRAAETAAVEGVLAAVRDGLSGVLVVRGDAGIGKTVLLEWAVGRAGDMRVARVAGVQAEMGLGFAGLHQLLMPFLSGVDGLPGPQRQALGSAFGLVAGPPPDRFLVGLAALTLLTDAAAGRPVLCLVDDAQWLDQVSVEVLGFIARRLYADRVGVLFTVREGEGPAAALAGLPEVVVGGLPGEAAGELLATSAGARVDGRVSAQIVSGVAGNPLALVELAAELTPAELSGAAPLSWPLRFGGQLEELYLARVRAMPPGTQMMLLVAAADPTGDPALVYEAAGQLGSGAEAGEVPGTSWLVSWHPRVRFRHPLIRSAAYYAAPPAARRRAHAALAAVTDPGTDPDRRAWHRAEAAAGPDEQVAAELERTASRAQARGGLAAAATFLERAMQLTPDPARRAARALLAAQANVRAGAFAKALELLTTAEAGEFGPLDEFQRALADLVRAQLAYVTSRGGEASPLLLKAARQLEQIDPSLSRATYLDALSAGMFAGRLASPGSGILEVARAAGAAPPSPDAPRAPDLLLDGLAAFYNDGYAAGVPMLRRALAAFGDRMSAEEELHWLWLACVVGATRVWDYDHWDVLSARHVQLARETGTLSELPLALTSRAYVLLFAGELKGAASLIDEVQAVKEATGSGLAPYGALALAALRGAEAEALAVIDATMADVTRRGEGVGITFAEWANAVLNNGLGHYDKAAAAAQRACSFDEDIGELLWPTTELIEAAARTGMTEAAAGALDRLEEMTGASDTNWGLGVRARSRALLSEGKAAERLYSESIARLGRTRLRVDLARAHLLYGEWLRRERRRRDAGEHLRTAHDMLEAMGMAAFAERARRELQATGARPRPGRPGAPEVLTPQEAQVARMVAGHLTNREIAARLFISASTVEYHLRKIFRKLGVTSRTQLARSFQGHEETPAWPD